jgi:hypothetical protein
MKQTSVEWLVNEIAEKYNFRFATYYGQEIQQAKEMEKNHQLSDEEIEMAAKEYVLYNDQKRDWVIEGMKLYREHLKQSKKN